MLSALSGFPLTARIAGLHSSDSQQRSAIATCCQLHRIDHSSSHLIWRRLRAQFALTQVALQVSQRQERGTVQSKQQSHWDLSSGNSSITRDENWRCMLLSYRM